jgi:hypothetical protein
VCECVYMRAAGAVGRIYCLLFLTLFLSIFPFASPVSLSRPLPPYTRERVGEMKDPKVMFEDMLDSQVDWCAYLLARRAGLLSISVRRSFQAKNT